MNNKLAIKTVKQYVFNILNNSLPDKLTYHNKIHTKDVYKNASEFAKYEKVTKKELMFLQIAALFHDLGYLQRYEKNEGIGAKMAKSYLKRSGFRRVDIKLVKNLILATTMPQRPKTKLQKVICDADLSNLGHKNFFSRSEALRKELNAVKNTRFTKNEWNKTQISFLSNHRFFTKAAKRLCGKTKEQNILKLKAKLT